MREKTYLGGCKRLFRVLPSGERREKPERERKREERETFEREGERREERGERKT